MLLVLDSVPETLKSKGFEWLHLSLQLLSSTSSATPSHVSDYSKFLDKILILFICSLTCWRTHLRR